MQKSVQCYNPEKYNNSKKPIVKAFILKPEQKLLKLSQNVQDDNNWGGTQTNKQTKTPFLKLENNTIKYNKMTVSFSFKITSSSKI